MIIERIKNFYRIVEYRKLQKVDVLVLGKYSDRIVSSIIKKTDNTYYISTGEIYHMNLKVFFFALFFRVKWIEYTKFSLLKAIFSWDHISYQAALIKTIRPKVIFTFIDNDKNFWLLSDRMKEQNFACIQNAWRFSGLSFNPEIKYVENTPVFFALGQVERDHYKRTGCSTENFIISGSISLDGYIENKPFNYKNRIHDITLVSQYVDGIFNGNLEEDFKNGYILLLKYLKRYSSVHHLRIHVATRKGTSDEFRFFKEKLGPQVSFDKGNGIGYQLFETLLRSNLVIVHDSTSGREALSKGVKVIHANFSGDLRYQYPLKTLGVLQNKSYKSFSRTLKNIKNMNKNKFCFRTRRNAQFVLRSSQSSNSIFIIKQWLEEKTKL